MRIIVVKDAKIVVAHYLSQESEVLTLYPDCEIGRYAGIAKPGSDVDVTKYTKLRDPLSGATS